MPLYLSLVCPLLPSPLSMLLRDSNREQLRSSKVKPNIRAWERERTHDRSISSFQNKSKDYDCNYSGQQCGRNESLSCSAIPGVPPDVWRNCDSRQRCLPHLFAPTLPLACLQLTNDSGVRMVVFLFIHFSNGEEQTSSSA